MKKNLLIEPSDVRAIYQIGTVDNKKLYQLIWTAQFDKLKSLINCDEWFNDLILNRNDFQPVIEEGTYTYNGQDFFNLGLKTVLATLVYAELLREGDVNVTNFGIKVKENDESRDVEESKRWNLFKTYIGRSEKYWESVKSFLLATNFRGFKEKCFACDDEKKGISLFKTEILTKD
jgi:hypothetical protein